MHSNKSFEEKVWALQQLICCGETIKAIQVYYDEDVKMQENKESPRIGKAVCQEHEKQNLRKVKEVSFKILNQAINHTLLIAFTEWQIVFLTKEEIKYELNQVSVRQWKGDKVINEKFYYREIRRLF